VPRTCAYLYCSLCAIAAFYLFAVFGCAACSEERVAEAVIKELVRSRDAYLYEDDKVTRGILLRDHANLMRERMDQINVTVTTVDLPTLVLRTDNGTLVNEVARSIVAEFPGVLSFDWSMVPWGEYFHAVELVYLHEPPYGTRDINADRIVAIVTETVALAE